MEKSTITGIGLGLFLIYGAIFLGDGVATFFDVASIIMVLGGTAAALMVTFSFDELKVAINGIKAFFGYQPPPMAMYVAEFTELSRMARREGLLALDRRLQELDDEFLKFGLEMAIDGVEEREIDELMKARIVTEMEDRKVTVKFFNNGGMFCPAFGMIGTLIGLVQMMQNLTDPSAIGQGMAVAMITTFYGALFSNLIFLPCAVKAKTQLSDMVKSRDMVRTGILAIVRGESPTIVEKRLKLIIGDQTGEEEPAEEAPALKKAA